MWIPGKNPIRGWRDFWPREEWAKRRVGLLGVLSPCRAGAGFDLGGLQVPASGAEVRDEGSRNSLGVGISGVQLPDVEGAPVEVVGQFQFLESKRATTSS